MYLISIILILLLLFYLYNYYYLVNNEPVQENFTSQVEIDSPIGLKKFTDTNVVTAPNIPMDKHDNHQTGGSNCVQLDGPLAPTNGKFVFPIPKFLYDGIW